MLSGSVSAGCSCILPELEFNKCLDRPPDILFIQFGENVLGVHSSRDLTKDPKLDLLWLWKAYPEIVVV